MIVKFLMHISFYITKVERELFGLGKENLNEEGVISPKFLLIFDSLIIAGAILLLSVPIRSIIACYINIIRYIYFVFVFSIIIESMLYLYMGYKHKYALYYPRFEEQHQNARIPNMVLWIFLILLYMLVSIGAFVIGCVLMDS